MTPQGERKVILLLNIIIGIAILGTVTYFLSEAHEMFIQDDAVGGWMAVGVASVFLAIGVLAIAANGDE